jgi:hypothetical protein
MAVKGFKVFAPFISIFVLPPQCGESVSVSSLKLNLDYSKKIPTVYATELSQAAINTEWLSLP